MSKQPCSEIYGGTGAFSEPETRAIKTFLTPKASKIGGTISFHSYGEYILYPWGYDSYVPKDHEDLAKLANEAAAVRSFFCRIIFETEPQAMVYFIENAFSCWT